MVQDMKIYIGHASSLDFRENLYSWLEGSKLDEKHEIVLPHKESDELFDSREFLENKCDLFVAEVSEPSTGLGIELGWADIYDVPVVCIYREGEKFSGSIEAITDRVIGYSSPEEIPDLILKQIEDR